jgi:hypothetical protein
MGAGVRFQVRMVSCRERYEVRAQTLASWAATDWQGTPIVEMDDGRAFLIQSRIEETWLRALRAAVSEEPEFILLLEDDLEFNRSLRHNLERWPALQRLGGSERPFFGSLYASNQPMLWRDPASRSAIAAPEGFWGAQALVLSYGTARHLLSHWQPGGLAHDLKAPRLAGEQGPIYCHVPSLVQHRVGDSTWGGGVHRATDFDPAYRVP